jgi:hypothetical protein
LKNKSHDILRISKEKGHLIVSMVIGVWGATYDEIVDDKRPNRNNTETNRCLPSAYTQ